MAKKMTKEECDNLTLIELEAKCQEQGLDSIGSREELTARLLGKGKPEPEAPVEPKTE